MKMAVVRTGGKQYIVSDGSELVVDNVGGEKGNIIELEKLADIDVEKPSVTLGTPTLKTVVRAEIIDSIRGDKIRVARFKAKSRYRKVRGFRAQLSKIKIVSI